MEINHMVKRAFFGVIIGCCFINLNLAQTNNQIMPLVTEQQFNGDGGTALNAVLHIPEGVAVDTKGNLFISDTFNNRVRKVDQLGIITTIAGNGEKEFSGDGGSALKAGLNSPTGLVVDREGNLLIADSGNNRIRKVDQSGVITTIVGNGRKEFSGDGSSALSAGLSGPLSLTISVAGNLFIADTGNNRIRKVNQSGIITTVAGNGHFEFSGDGGFAVRAALKFPTVVAIDAKENLFIADKQNNRIRKVDQSGVITTVAGNGKKEFSGDGGSALSAGIFPDEVIVDAKGNLFIADAINGRIRKVDQSGIITTIAGNGRDEFSGDGGPALKAGLFRPERVAIDIKGNLFIADAFNNRVRKVDTMGIITTVVGNGKKEVTGLAIEFVE